MKQFYISLFILCAALSAKAQLTQINHAPVPSYTYAMFQCDSTDIINNGPGLSGANVTWNYSTIGTHTDIVTNYSTAISTNPAYPNASVVVTSSQGMAYYYDSTPNDLTLHGGDISFGGFAATLIYTNVPVVAVYPMSLNSTTSSAIAGSLSIIGAQLPLSGAFTGSSHVVADGSGTLILPGTTTATFNNVLRVVTSQTIYAAFSTTLGAVDATLTLMTFDYYSIGTRSPMFSIQSVDASIYIAFLGGPPINMSQILVFRDVSTGIAPMAPTAHFNLSSNAVCMTNNTVTSVNNSSGTAPLSYSWSSSANNSVTFNPSNTTATPNISFSNAGTYTIILTTSNSAGANSFSRTVVVSDCVGIDKLNAENTEWTVYPNPASSFVNFSTNGSNAATVAIYDITGKLVKEISFTNGKANLNTTEMSNGLYIYKVKSLGNDTLKTGKVVVNH